MDPRVAERIYMGKEARDKLLDKAIELASGGNASAGHDSAARRELLKKHLEGLGLSKSEVLARLTADISTAHTPQQALGVSKEREREQKQQRSRDREARGKEGQARGIGD